jgi:hypothetical protein
MKIFVISYASLNINEIINNLAAHYVSDSDGGNLRFFLNHKKAEAYLAYAQANPENYSYKKGATLEIYEVSLAIVK